MSHYNACPKVLRKDKQQTVLSHKLILVLLQITKGTVDGLLIKQAELEPIHTKYFYYFCHVGS